MARLIDALACALVERMRSLGFQPRAFKVAAKAKAFMQVKPGGVGFTRRAADGKQEFIYFQAGTEGQVVVAFAGWAPQPGVIPAPLSASEFPTPQRDEYMRDEYLFPLFAVLEDPATGRRHHASRLEGDGWLLVPAGPTPPGESDAALALGIAAQLKARVQSAELMKSERQAAAVEELAARIRADVVRVLSPYLEGRVEASEAGRVERTPGARR